MSIHLVDAGYDVVETEVPDLTGTWRLWCDLIMTELSVLQETQMRELGSADFRQTLDGFLKMATILDLRARSKGLSRQPLGSSISACRGCSTISRALAAVAATLD